MIMNNATTTGTTKSFIFGSAFFSSVVGVWVVSDAVTFFPDGAFETFIVDVCDCVIWCPLFGVEVSLFEIANTVVPNRKNNRDVIREILLNIIFNSTIL